MKKSIIKRNEVFAGELVNNVKTTFEVFDENDNQISGGKISTSYVSCTKIYRAMLFSVDENGCANDLIYNTPNVYPIVNDAQNEKTKYGLMVSHCTSLDALLKYLNYGEDLTQQDLKQIYKRLLQSNYWLEHGMNMGGFIHLSDFFHVNKSEIIPIELYKQLINISYFKKGTPSIEEPGYSYIKRIK